MSEDLDTARRAMCEEINNAPMTREQLKVLWGEEVWDTEELQRSFTVHGFMAPFVVVTRKSDGVRGSVTFQHHPRLYYGFEPG
jgi:hypothetical protein